MKLLLPWRPVFAKAITTIDRLIAGWLKRKFRYLGAAIATLPIALKHTSLKIPSWRPVFAPTVTAVNRLIAGRLKWKFRYRSAAIAALPITLKHLPLKTIILFKSHVLFYLQL